MFQNDSDIDSIDVSIWFTIGSPPAFTQGGAQSRLCSFPGGRIDGWCAGELNKEDNTGKWNMKD